ncbi:MAG: SDR family oxidoreductase [Alicyclobacillus sp.]|nr:SDR family oxidoreductase [Alicyclobacillus sp.]
MLFSGHTVLITGGATGIGRGLAEAFWRRGSQVIVCGRRTQRLKELAEQLPGITVRVCDVSQPDERFALYTWVVDAFPGLNVLVNNAGIQQDLDFAADPGLLQSPDDWQTLRSEIAVNLEAPIHLSALFIPHLRQQAKPAIVNISSGLAFAPLARTPVYCATKAALHSWTLSLRHQLAHTGIEVIEIIPPMVDTELNMAARERMGPNAFRGVPVAEFIEAVVTQIEQGSVEVAYGSAETARLASRAELDTIFQRMNTPGGH